MDTTESQEEVNVTTKSQEEEHTKDLTTAASNLQGMTRYSPQVGEEMKTFVPGI
jgi:hypothetical protein